MPEDIFTPDTEDRSFAKDKMVRDWLRKPFPPEQIGKIPASKGRPALDFVGHAAVTDRLNKIVPGWDFHIIREFTHGGAYWIHGSIQIGGVVREEYGDGDNPKEALGNFIRRGAMRFGVGLDLWSREELESSPAAGPTSPRTVRVGAASKGALPPAGGTSSEDPTRYGEGRERSSEASSGERGGHDGKGAASTSSPDPSAISSAGTGPGGAPPETPPRDGTSKAPSGPTFVADPLSCDHRYGTGAVAKVRIGGKDLCRLCGTPWITAMEGTTQDLGAPTA